MGRKKNVRELRTYGDANKYLCKSGLHKEEGSRHTKYYADDGRHISIPRHRRSQDMPNGLRHAIIKAIIALGFGIIMFMLWYFYPALLHYGIL